MTPLAYLMRQLNDRSDFTPQWSRCTDQDKATLKRWANEEMTVLGIEVKG